MCSFYQLLIDQDIVIAYSKLELFDSLLKDVTYASLLGQFTQY